MPPPPWIRPCWNVHLKVFPPNIDFRMSISSIDCHLLKLFTHDIVCLVCLFLSFFYACILYLLFRSTKVSKLDFLPHPFLIYCPSLKAKLDLFRYYLPDEGEYRRYTTRFSLLFFCLVSFLII